MVRFSSGKGMYGSPLSSLLRKLVTMAVISFSLIGNKIKGGVLSSMMELM